MKDPQVERKTGVIGLINRNSFAWTELLYFYLEHALLSRCRTIIPPELLIL